MSQKRTDLRLPKHVLKCVHVLAGQLPGTPLVGILGKKLNRFAVGDAIPDLTFVIDVDAATARARLLRRVRPVQALDRMEQEPPEFYQRVTEAYRELARREPRRVILINGSPSAEQVEAETWRIVSSGSPLSTTACSSGSDDTKPRSGGKRCRLTFCSKQPDVAETPSTKTLCNPKFSGPSRARCETPEHPNQRQNNSCIIKASRRFKTNGFVP